MFRNRAEAGRALAVEIAALQQTMPALEDPVVLALPRGGVPVGLEIASEIRAPLDLLLVRKIGVPFQPELAAGAVVDGETPQVVWNEDVIDMAGLDHAELAEVEKYELAEIERRRAVYFKEHPRVSVAGRAAIVVDDGIATGATVRAALKAVRRREPRFLVLAVPVAPVDAVVALRPLVDRVICLEMPEPFEAIGLHYNDFEQVSDSQVMAALETSRLTCPTEDLPD